MLILGVKLRCLPSLKQKQIEELILQAIKQHKIVKELNSTVSQLRTRPKYLKIS